MNALKITFIGFGEVASIFSDAICKKGAMVCVYDILNFPQKSRHG